MRRKRRKHSSTQEMVLSITSMADIFTILLVFLLKSYSTGASTITPSSSIVLPEAERANPVIDTLKVEISPSGILVDEKPIVSLDHFSFSKNDLNHDLPQKLTTVLKEQRKKESLKKYPRMLVLADQDTPYSTLRKVLGSASESGFVDYKLVVVQPQ